MHRYLRISFSATCGVLCLLLIALWVRSYHQRDNLIFRIPSTRAFSAESALGQFGVFIYPDTERSAPAEYFVVPASSDPCHPANNQHGFQLRAGGGYAAIVVPHWLLVVALITAFALRNNWPKRFSLRTLLIAITLVAVLLGAIVISMR